MLIIPNCFSSDYESFRFCFKEVVYKPLFVFRGSENKE